MSQNGVTSYATFVCWPGFAYRALLLLALAFVLFYEAINGFHAQPTPWQPLSIPARCVLSSPGYGGGVQLFGCFAGWSECCLAIVHMLPTDLLLNMGSSHGLPWCSLCCWRRLSGTWVPGTWFTCIQLSYADWRDHRDWFNNALMTGTSVVDALNIPKVLIFSVL